MNKLVPSLYVVLTLTLGISLTPTFSSAAEFSYDGQPTFTVTYPEGSTPDVAPGTIWCIKTPEEVTIQAAIVPVIEGVELKDITEKRFKPFLENLQGTTVKVVENREITLSDGTKTYYSELEYISKRTKREMVVVKVAVLLKDGKILNVMGYPWKERGERGPLVSKAIEIVKSLKFK